MCVWSLSDPSFHGGSGGGRTMCVLSLVLFWITDLLPHFHSVVHSVRVWPNFRYCFLFFPESLVAQTKVCEGPG